MKKAHGFTLIEMMLAVIIMGILITLAYPNYLNNKKKGILGSAKSFMLTVVNKQTEYRSINRQYALDNVTGDGSALVKLKSEVPSEINDHFDIKIYDPTANGISEFIVELRPKANDIMDGYERTKDDGTTIKLGDTDPEVALTINSLDQKRPNEFW